VFVNGYEWNTALEHYGASLVYVHNIAYNTWSLINPVAWSFEIEVQFYVLVPLLASVFLIANTALRRTVIVAAIVATGSLRFFVDLWAIGMARSILSDGHYFLIGFLMCDLYMNEWRTRTEGSYVYDVFVALGLLGVYAYNETVVMTPANRVLTAISLAAIFVGAFGSRIFISFLRNRLITVIGGTCYTIYLIHYPLIAFLMQGTIGLHAPGGFLSNVFLQMAILLPAIAIIGGLTFRVIEKPFMYPDWPQRFVAFVHARGRSSEIEPS